MFAADRPESLGFDAARLGRIRAWMEGYVAGGRYPFACTAIARRGEIAYCDYLGNRDLEAGTPYTLDTIVRIYSMTKPVTAVAALMLYEEGRLHLDDPLADFLPEFAEPLVLRDGARRLDQVAPARETLTLHHLLTHTSGLVYGSQGGLLGEAYKAQPVKFGPAGGGLAANVKRLSGLPLLFEPGRRWNYGVSTDVLGRVIEVVSGQTLDAFFRERVLGPLAMADTGFEVAAENLGRLAMLYGSAGDGAMAARDGTAQSEFRAGRVDTFSGGGGLLSTAGDYLRFAEMLRRGGQLRRLRLGRGREHGVLDRSGRGFDRAVLDPALAVPQLPQPHGAARPGLPGADRLRPAEPDPPAQARCYSVSDLPSCRATEDCSSSK